MRICVDTQVSVASLLDGFDLFCSCDLDLDPMTFIYKLDPYSLEIHRMCKYELCMSRLSIVIVWQTCRHTDRQNRPQNKPQRFAGGQKYKTQCYLHSIMGVGWNAIVQCWLRHCSRRQTDRQTDTLPCSMFCLARKASLKAVSKNTVCSKSTAALLLIKLQYAAAAACVRRTIIIISAGHRVR